MASKEKITSPVSELCARYVMSNKDPRGVTIGFSREHQERADRKRIREGDLIIQSKTKTGGARALAAATIPDVGDFGRIQAEPIFCFRESYASGQSEQQGCI